MPNFKAEYTLEMVLDLIEADLKAEGFNLSDAPITFHLAEFNKSSLILNIEKADRNAIPSFLDQSSYPQEVNQPLLGPAPLTEQAPAPAPALVETPPAGPKIEKRTGNPPSEAELARRARISAHMKKVRADQRAAKAEKEKTDLAETISDLYPHKPQPARSERGYTVNEYDLPPEPELEPEPETGHTKAEILAAGQEVIEVTPGQLFSLLTSEPESPAPKSKYATGEREPSEKELARRKLVGENNRRRAQQRADERARIDRDQAHAKEIIARKTNPMPTYNNTTLAERQVLRQRVVEQRLNQEATPTPAPEPAQVQAPVIEKKAEVVAPSVAPFRTPFPKAEVRFYPGSR